MPIAYKTTTQSTLTLLVLVSASPLSNLDWVLGALKSRKEYKINRMTRAHQRVTQLMANGRGPIYKAIKYCHIQAMAPHLQAEFLKEVSDWGMNPLNPAEAFNRTNGASVFSLQTF